MAADFPNNILNQMIQHDQALEEFPFLSAQILNRWRRDGKVRFFKGKEGKVSYPRTDLNDALIKEMECGETEDPRDFGNIKTSGSVSSPVETATTATGMMKEADALREKLWLQSISKQPKKNLSPSSVSKSRPETRERSSSLTS